ncbi:MAG: hypothetical protein AB7P22_17595, partial [Vicinamibacterales bacterium]
MNSVPVSQVAQLLGLLVRDVYTLLERRHGIRGLKPDSRIELNFARGFIAQIARERGLSVSTQELFAGSKREPEETRSPSRMPEASAPRDAPPRVPPGQPIQSSQQPYRGTVRIYKVAELLGTTSQEVAALLKRDHGIEAKSASSTIEVVVARQFVDR